MNTTSQSPGVGGSAGAAPQGGKPSFAARARHEIEEILVRILFLWVMFGLFELNHMAILAKEQINYWPHGFALINAIVMSKVLLIAEQMNFAKRFHERRLVWSILYKSAMFSILFIVVHVTEEVIKGLFDGHRFFASLPQGEQLQLVLCSAAILFIALTPYFAYREVGRVIGPEKLHNLIFKERPPGSVADIG